MVTQAKKDAFPPEPSVRFGLQSKLLTVMAFIMVVSFFAAFIGYRNLTAIAESSREVSEHDVPITRAIKISLIELLSGEIALESALGVDDFSMLEEIRKYEAAMEHSNLLFETYINAIAWGSETTAFAKSGGGLNLLEWNRKGLAGYLVIKPPTEQEAQLAGAIDIYFGGFVKNAFMAVAKHKAYLRIKSDKYADSQAAQSAAIERDRARGTALRYAGLIVENLNEIVELTNENVVQTSAHIALVEQRSKLSFILIFIFSAVISLIAIFIFARKSIIDPLNELVRVVKWFGAGDLTVRANVGKKDELGLLARMLNKMAEDLMALYSSVRTHAQEQNRDLQDTIETLKREKGNLDQNINDMARIIAEQKALISKLEAEDKTAH